MTIEEQFRETVAKLELKVMEAIGEYEATIFEMIRLLEHARHTSDVERAKRVGEKALEGSRYDRNASA